MSPVKGIKALVVTLTVTGLVTTNLRAGPEAGGAPAKQVAPLAPSGCNWGGFYLGLNVGGQFGHSEDKDLDDYNFPDKPWGYSESGVIAGEEIGYNWQFGWFVFGPEIDGGYMNLDGRGTEPGFPHDTVGESSSDFYATFRGRIGLALDCWLIYATGGGIGVNWKTTIVDDSFTIEGPDTINASKEEFRWGYTAGGGIERMFNCWGHRWSLKAEYLYFKLGDRTFDSLSGNGFGPYGWRADAQGHIARAGFNFHF